MDDTCAMDCILAIDQGSHASRALLFDADGGVIARHEAVVDQFEPHPGWVELAPEQVLETVRTVIGEVLPKASGPVRCAGLAVQRSTLVAWDRDSGRALAPALSWQDTRCRDLLRAFAPHERRIHGVTGLPVSPHYLAGKMRWLLDHHEAVARAHAKGALVMGPLASYLAWHLLEGHPLIADHSNAARSLLFDLGRLQWSPDLAALFRIDPDLLPACVPTLADHGVLAGTAIPLTCLCGDQNAAIHAGGEPPEDQALLNLGTGAFLLRDAGERPPAPDHLIGGIAWSTAGARRYLLEGTVNGVGSAIRWLQQQTDTDILGGLPGWLREIRDAPLFVNSIGGLGSPYWRQDVEARFIPATQSAARRAVAVIDSIAFLVRRNLEEMHPDSLRAIQVSGGLSRLDGLCQRISDLAGLPVRRHEDPEATARGVAWLAANRPAHWRRSSPGSTFCPVNNVRLKQRYGEFVDLLERDPGLVSPPCLNGPGSGSRC
jgi:glycerol kinase